MGEVIVITLERAVWEKPQQLPNRHRTCHDGQKSGCSRY